MKVTEFRSKIHSGQKMSLAGREFIAKEVVRFRFDDGSIYVKCFLGDGYALADDSNENIFILVKEVDADISEPFPKAFRFDGKEFAFSYSAHATAYEIEGEEIFKKGHSELFSDYKADDGSYLSLGVVEETGKRMDLYGKILTEKDVRFV